MNDDPLREVRWFMLYAVVLLLGVGIWLGCVGALWPSLFAASCVVLAVWFTLTLPWPDSVPSYRQLRRAERWKQRREP